MTFKESVNYRNLILNFVWTCWGRSKYFRFPSILGLGLTAEHPENWAVLESRYTLTELVLLWIPNANIKSLLN